MTDMFKITYWNGVKVQTFNTDADTEEHAHTHFRASFPHNSIIMIEHPSQVPTYTTTLQHVLSDVSLVTQGFMSERQCITYAQQYLEQTGHTVEEQKLLYAELLSVIQKSKEDVVTAKEVMECSGCDDGWCPGCVPDMCVVPALCQMCTRVAPQCQINYSKSDKTIAGLFTCYNCAYHIKDTTYPHALIIPLKADDSAESMQIMQVLSEHTEDVEKAIQQLLHTPIPQFDTEDVETILLSAVYPGKTLREDVELKPDSNGHDIDQYVDAHPGMKDIEVAILFKDQREPILFAIEQHNEEWDTPYGVYESRAERDKALYVETLNALQTACDRDTTDGLLDLIQRVADTLHEQFNYPVILHPDRHWRVVSETDEEISAQQFSERLTEQTITETRPYTPEQDS